MFCSVLAKIFVDQFYYYFSLRHPLLLMYSISKLFWERLVFEDFSFPMINLCGIQFHP